MEQRAQKDNKNNVINLLSCWEKRSLTAIEAHYETSRSLSRLHKLLGVVIVSLSVFVTIAGANATVTSFGGGLPIVFAGALLLALSMIQLFLNIPESAERHRVAAAKHSSIRRGIEQLAAVLDMLDKPELIKAIENIRKQYVELSTEAPGIPHKYWRYGRDIVVKSEESATT